MYIRVSFLPQCRCEFRDGMFLSYIKNSRSSHHGCIYEPHPPRVHQVSSTHHEPEHHQAWAGPLLTYCNTFREHTVYYVYTPLVPP